MRAWQVERRKRTRHVIELGGLVVKAGIVDLTGDDRAIILGALLWMADKLRIRAGASALGGYLTGIVLSTGPLSVPLLLFYGLTKGAFLATEAASSLGVFLSKSATFRHFGAPDGEVASKG
jgi:hypothetical protein